MCSYIWIIARPNCIETNCCIPKKGWS